MSEEEFHQLDGCPCLKLFCVWTSALLQFFEAKHELGRVGECDGYLLNIITVFIWPVNSVQNSVHFDLQSYSFSVAVLVIFRKPFIVIEPGLELLELQSFLIEHLWREIGALGLIRTRKTSTAERREGGLVLVLLLGHGPLWASGRVTLNELVDGSFELVEFVLASARLEVL